MCVLYDICDMFILNIYVYTIYKTLFITMCMKAVASKAISDNDTSGFEIKFRSFVIYNPDLSKVLNFS